MGHFSFRSTEINQTYNLVLSSLSYALLGIQCQMILHFRAVYVVLYEIVETFVSSCTDGAFPVKNKLSLNGPLETA
jgi:hypothetical protein